MRGGQRLRATAIDVPADISSAAFFLVGASIAAGSDLLLEHVGINPTRTGVIDILRLMGADIAVRNPREVGGEPVADLRVRAAPLRGIAVPPERWCRWRSTNSPRCSSRPPARGGEPWSPAPRNCASRSPTGSP